MTSPVTPSPSLSSFSYTVNTFDEFVPTDVRGGAYGGHGGGAYGRGHRRTGRGQEGRQRGARRSEGERGGARTEGATGTGDTVTRRSDHGDKRRSSGDLILFVYHPWSGKHHRIVPPPLPPYTHQTHQTHTQLRLRGVRCQACSVRCGESESFCVCVCVSLSGYLHHTTERITTTIPPPPPRTFSRRSLLSVVSAGRADVWMRCPLALHSPLYSIFRCLTDEVPAEIAGRGLRCTALTAPHLEFRSHPASSTQSTNRLWCRLVLLFARN
jgi:hypothetical protein